MHTISKTQMDVIGKKHGISPRYRKAFLLLANKGIIDDDTFTTRLWACRNYQHAFNDVMTFISGDLV